jgi:chorismate--pyruvate lyase
VCGARFALRVIDLWPGELDAGLRLSLRAGDRTGLFRDVEMRCADQVLVFAQTVMPDSTVSAHPWLAELGDAALGETLGGLSGVERSPYEYAWLPADDGLTARALRAAGAEPARLWARRSRFALRGAPLLIQEVFLPSLSRTPDFA